MTQSRSPQDRSIEVDQEPIWDPAEDDALTPDDPPPASPAGPAPRSGRSPAHGGPRRLGGAPGTWTQSLTSTAPLPGPAGLLIADVPNRIIALILDVILLAIVGLLLALLIGGAFGGLETGRSLDSAGGGLNIGAFLVVGVAQLAISFGFFGYSWVVLRATPGMKMLRLQIGDQVDGHSISWNQALLRWLLLGIAATLVTYPVYVPSAIGLLLGVVALAWLVVLLYSIGQSPAKQGFHDRHARTILIRAARHVS
jgi:hypothetical protein